MVVAKRVPDRIRVEADPERQFWALAGHVAAHTGNSYVSYERLKQQYASSFPGASHVEYEQAMKRLAALLRI